MYNEVMLTSAKSLYSRNFLPRKTSYLLFVVNVILMNGSTCFPSQFWTESFVQWSPLGTYLATVHRQGAALWGGATTFNRLMRCAHPQVEFAFLVLDFTLYSVCSLGI